MRYLNHQDMNTLIHYNDVKTNMSENLEEIKHTLIRSLKDFSFCEIFSSIEQEYVYQLYSDDIEVRFGYDWSQGTLYLVFELITECSEELPLLKRKWKSQITDDKITYIKYARMIDFLFIGNHIEEEYEYNKFVNIACSQIINSVKRKNQDPLYEN